MSVFSLKLLACLTMLACHVGNAFGTLLPDELYTALIVLGRPAFPLFAALMVSGWEHTRHKGYYLRNVALGALLSQIPFTLAIFPGEGPLAPHLNTLFTLLMGMLSMALLDLGQEENRRWAIPLALLPPLAALLLSMDYGVAGALLLPLLHLTRDSRWRLAVLTLTLAGIYWAQPLYMAAALASVPLLAMMRPGKSGPSWQKPAFYAFYPAHLAILALLRFFLA